jgi:hypothetical protein
MAVNDAQVALSVHFVSKMDDVNAVGAPAHVDPGPRWREAVALACLGHL